MNTYCDENFTLKWKFNHLAVGYNNSLQNGSYENLSQKFFPPVSDSGQWDSHIKAWNVTS